MKQHWDNMSETMLQFNDLMNQLSDNATDTRMKKAAKKMIDVWNKIIFQRNELDNMIEPIKPILNNMPFNSSDFSEIWKLYKEYMIEDHNTIIGSRREKILLDELKKISKSDEKRAIELIRFYVRNGYKSLFQPSDKQLAGTEPVVSEESFNFSRPKKEV